MSTGINEHTKQVFDFLSFTTVLATLAAWLPPLAALASIIWTGIRIYETTTVQRWVNRRKLKNQIQKESCE